MDRGDPYPRQRAVGHCGFLCRALSVQLPEDRVIVTEYYRNIGLTAITTMTEAHYVNKGEIIFIHTVAGGLGLAFTAYAKSRGATVIGTTSSPEKAQLAKSYGADHVILYNKENVVERTLELTNGEGVHAVFDGVGKDT
jgi:NADPH:quinone reductase